MAASLARVGRHLGRTLRHEVTHNLDLFLARAGRRGFTARALATLARREGPPESCTAELVSGLAAGCGVAEELLLAYNLWGDTLDPEGCTVVAAVGSRGAHGGTIVLKNSDKVGDPGDVGEGFHQGKEITVILRLAQEGKPALMGVSAAGNVGVKMGINDRGVVAASNLARTRSFSEAKLAVGQVRVTGRNLIMRAGLESESAQAAVSSTVHRLVANPMGTPGNVHFYDNTAGYILEGCAEAVAVERIPDGGLGVRANRFQVMHDRNDPEDVSSQARYVRASTLARSRDRVDVELLRRVSCDHEHGPGPDSICRHSTDPAEEVTLAAAIMEVDPADPRRSRIHVALGKPCHAWPDPSGHVTVALSDAPEAIPLPFRDGSGFKRFYQETPA